MIRTIIVDDELSAQEVLKSMISEYCPNIRIIDTADSVKTAVNSIIMNKPQLVFMDIQLKESSGFSVLESLRDMNFEVVFTTAYDNHAIKAIKFSALDYLLKPISKDELIHAVQKAARQLEKENLNKRVVSLLENIKQGNINKKIAIQFMTGFKVIDVNFITRCEADRNYTHIYLTDGLRETASRSLKEFEDLLKDHNFMRIHQSHLINLNHVKNYIKGRGGLIELTDGCIVELARSKKEEFIKYFM